MIDYESWRESTEGLEAYWQRRLERCVRGRVAATVMGGSAALLGFIDADAEVCRWNLLFNRQVQLLMLLRARAAGER